MKTWMKWGACAVVGLLPLTGSAEESQETRRTLVLVQPMSAPWGLVGASVEHAVGTHVSLAASVDTQMVLNDFRSDELGTGFFTQRWGLGVSPGVHVYVMGHAPEGLWVGAHLEAQKEFISSQDDLVTPEGSRRIESGWDTLSYGGSARVGYTVILSPGLTAQVGLGLGALRSQTTTFKSEPATPEERETRRDSWVVAPRMTLGVGWAF